MNLLRDALLSFCPEAFRREHRPYSPSSLVTAAIVLGLLQLVLCALLLAQRYRDFMIARALVDRTDERATGVGTIRRRSNHNF